MPKLKRKNVLDEDMIKVISETAIEKYREAEKKDIKIKKDKRLHNVKQLMNNYKRIEQSVKNAKAEDQDEEVKDLDIQHLMTSEFMVESLTQSKSRSKLMLDHVDKTLEAYKQICVVENVEERYRLLHDRYIKNIPAHQLSEKYALSRRTFYRQIDRACEDMSVLLFGIDAVNFEVD